MHFAFKIDYYGSREGSISFSSKKIITLGILFVIAIALIAVVLKTKNPLSNKIAQERSDRIQCERIIRDYRVIEDGLYLTNERKAVFQDAASNQPTKKTAQSSTTALKAIEAHEKELQTKRDVLKTEYDQCDKRVKGEE